MVSSAHLEHPVVQFESLPTPSAESRQAGRQVLPGAPDRTDVGEHHHTSTSTTHTAFFSAPEQKILPHTTAKGRFYKIAPNNFMLAGR